MNNRGVTPLIATLMLIAFSVGLGAIVMAWGQSYIEEKAEFITTAQNAAIGCDQARISIISLGGTKQICAVPGANTVKAYIENGPNVEIFNIQARVMGASGVDTIDGFLPSGMVRAAAAMAQLTHRDVGALKQLKLTPIVTVDNKKQYCDKRAITIEEPFAPCAK